MMESAIEGYWVVVGEKSVVRHKLRLGLAGILDRYTVCLDPVHAS